jgi:NAD-dependent dihydropyrimidine dehydrogenase PreA subunit
MASRAVRKIVRIDEEKCNGCGECVPSCAEGAIRIVGGKAKLVADKLCDGMGACLGHCPMGAITVEERPAEGFDHEAVKLHLSPAHAAPTAAAAPIMTPMHGSGAGGGCPGSRMRVFEQVEKPAPARAGQQGTALRQWPVQLALLPTQSPIWQDADVLLAADCVPFAYPDFHTTMLPGKTLAIACPKLDEVEPYVNKLAEIFASNTIRSITIARMEVPCCGGLVRIVQAALAMAGKEIPVKVVVMGIRGVVKGEE